MLGMHQNFQATDRHKRGGYEQNQANGLSSQAAQCFVKMAFIPDESVHLSLSRFLTNSEKNHLYPCQSLSIPIAVLDRGGEKAAVAQLADSLRGRLIFSSPITPQEIQGFLPISDVYPDVSTGFIVAIFKDGSFFQSCNKIVIDFVQQDPYQPIVSFWPEFDPSCYRPFMTIGRVNKGKREQKQIAEMLTEKLRLNPLNLTFEFFFCEPFYFNFEKYFASVDLEACVLPSKTLFSAIH